MADPQAALEHGAAELLGRELTELEASQFSNYLELLLKWQRTSRLVGRASGSWIVENLILDSLLFLRVLPDPVDAVVDIGAGAGFPGLPIKVVRPETTLLLIEARRRRASFLSATVRKLALRNVEVVNARAEDVVEQFAGRFDAAVMRCAGSIDDLIPLARRFVRATGCVVVSGPPGSKRSVSGWNEVEVPGLSGVRSGAPRLFRVARAQP